MKKRDFKHLLKTVDKTSNNEMRSAKFRYLNEQLYTKGSKSAAHIFKERPELFADVSLVSP